MRLATRFSRKASDGAVVASRPSPYRVGAEVAPDPAVSPAPQVELGVAGALLFAWACASLRFVLFLAGPERLGVDPLLALAASATTAYYLARVLRG